MFPVLAELLKDQENLHQLMGETAQEQRQKIKDRLRRRKERLAQGTSFRILLFLSKRQHFCFVMVDSEESSGPKINFSFFASMNLNLRHLIG